MSPFQKGNTVGKGRHHSEETKKKISEAKKRAWKDKDIRKKTIESFHQRWERPEEHKKTSDAIKEKWKDEEYRTKASASQSIRFTEAWKNPEYRDRTLKAMMKGLKHRPTSLEKKMIRLLKNKKVPFKYVGDGVFLIDGRNPDFVALDGRKICLEIGNVFHHPPSKVIEKIRHYELNGWRVIYIVDDLLNTFGFYKILREEGFL